MKNIKSQNRKAFTLFEFILVLGLIALTIPIIINIKNSISKIEKRYKTISEINTIKNVIEKTYLANLQYIENNCAGYGDSQCSTLSLLPTIKDTNTLEFHIKDSLSYNLNPLKNYSCLINKVATDTYDVKCYDYFGKLMSFSGTNLPTPGKEYVLPYEDKYPSITITTKYFSKNLQFDNLIKFSIAKTVQKEVDIGNAIKRFTRTIRLRELANDCSDGGNSNNPPNGLGSWDDAMVPWIWELVSQQPGVLCSGSTSCDSNACGCENLDTNSNYWETNSNFCIIDDDTTWQRVLNNLGLDKNYRVDGFGNVITITLLSDANGNPVDCPPKAPYPNYDNIPVYPKTRIGIAYNCEKQYNGTFNQQCEWYSVMDIYGE